LAFVSSYISYVQLLNNKYYRNWPVQPAVSSFRSSSKPTTSPTFRSV
jgi:hypothetical protein